MLNLNPTVIIMLFSMSLVGTYFTVRMGKVRPVPGFVIGSIMTSMFLCLYAMSRGNTLIHALVVGPLLGFAFTGLGVAIGLFYRYGVTSSVRGQPSVGSMHREPKRPKASETGHLE
jgi:hypothetical protein